MPPLLTLSEAAEHFRVSERTLRRLIIRIRPGELRAKRRILLDAQAVNNLTEALRCRSKSTRGKVRDSSGSAAPSEVKAFEKALELLTGN